MRIVIALVAFFISAPAFAQSATSPSNQPQDQANKQQSAPDKRGTHDAPLIIKELTRERTAEETKEATEKAELDRKLTRYTADLARYTELLFGATVILAVLTGALAIAAFLQIREGKEASVAAKDAAKAASDSAKSTAALAAAAVDHAGHAETNIAVTKDAAKRQLRAYVFLKVTGITDQDSPADRFAMHFDIMNNGQTPAYRVRIVSRTCIAPNPIGNNFDFSVPRRSREGFIMIGPQDSIAHDSLAQFPFTENEIRETAKPNGTWRICTYGTVFYDDCFGDEQFTNFCFLVEYEPIEGQSVRITTYPAERHNDAS